MVRKVKGRPSAPGTAPKQAESQRELVTAFTAGLVAGAPAPITRIDTHLSHVFLTGEVALKLKRALRLPFVDFESRDARRAACEAELVVNRPLAGRLYLDVRPVTRSAQGGFQIGGAGPVVDWIVAMRRFDQAQQFDRLARAGALTQDNVEGAVDRLVEAHAAASPNREAGHAADYRNVIHGLRKTEEHGAAKLGLQAESPILFGRLDVELTNVSALIEERSQEGKVRRGHGDLHLRNICLFEGRPTLFDALEFDSRLATTDVIHDLAFLLMDLRRVGLAGHANAAMNRYWDATGESETALKLLPFFMALRSAVRMAVAMEAGDLSEAQGYRALALRLIDRRPPMLLAIAGLSGSGKSAVAKALAPHLPAPAGARLLRTDMLRKRRANFPPDKEAGEDTYSVEQRLKVYREMTERAAAAVNAGASAVVDATFLIDSTRDLILDAARGVRFHAYWLDVPLAVRVARVSKRIGDVSDADIAVAAAQEEPRSLSGPWRRVNADRPLDEIVAEIARDLAEDARHGFDLSQGGAPNPG